MRLQRENGAAAVEFALVSTLLFLLLFGIIAFGFALFRQQTAVHAAREGARLAAVADYTDCNDFYAKVRAKAPSVDLSKVSLILPDGQDTYGHPVEVSIDYTVNLAVIAWIPGIPNTLDLTQTATSRIEQTLPTSGCAPG